MQAPFTYETSAPRTLSASAPSRGAGSATVAASALAPLFLVAMTCALLASCLSAPALAAMAASGCLVAFAGGLTSAAFKGHERALLVVAAAAALAALSWILVSPSARAALYALYNAIVWRVDDAYGLFAELIAPGDTVAGSVGFGVCLGLLVADAWWGITRLRHSSVTLALVAVICCTCLHLKTGAGFACMGLGVAGWLAHCRLAELKGARTMWAAFLLNLAVAAAVMALLYGISTVLYTPRGIVADVRAAAVDAFENLRFGDAVLPEGDLAAAADMNRDDGDTLRVTVSGQPADDLLLRGYVGSAFANGSWSPVDHTAYEGEWRGMGSWLEGRGFTPSLQRALYEGRKTKTQGGSKRSTLDVSIDSSGGTARYAFVPYTLDDASGLSFAVDADGMFRDLYWGKRSYSYTIDNVAATETYDDASWLATAGGTYASSERVYGAFAQATYTKVGKREAADIDRLIFDPATWDADAATTPYAVISRVRTMLDTLASYSDTPAAPELGRDGKTSFTSWFLEGARRGNSAYFATVATLAFRTQGIPARYVEGYRASRSELSAAASRHRALTLDDADVHAWCEVYLDGLGWTPVEVTPGFYSQALDADEVIDVSEAWSGGSEDDALQAGSVLGDVKEPEEDEAQARPFFPTWFIHLMATLGALALVAAVCVVQRLVRMELRARACMDDDPAVCIPALYSYLTAIMHASGVPFDPTRPLDGLDGFEDAFDGVDLDEYRRVIELHQLYAFGGKRLRAHELRTIRRTTARMHEALRPPVGLRARITRYAVDIL